MTTIQTRAGRVAYRESGSGPTILLLHATLHDRHDFDPIVGTLARRYRTVALGLADDLTDADGSKAGASCKRAAHAPIQIFCDYACQYLRKASVISFRMSGAVCWDSSRRSSLSRYTLRICAALSRSRAFAVGL